MEEEKKEETKSTDKMEEKKVEQKKVNDKKVEDKKVATETKKAETPKQTKKKFENTKTEKKKSNNNVVIIAIAIIAILIITIIIYNVITSNTPQKSINTMLNALKTGNYDNAREVVANYDEWVNNDILDGEELNKEAQTLLFNELSWKVLNVKEDGDKATAEVEITTKDFKTILGNYMQKAIKTAFSGQEVNDEQMTNYLIEELNNSEIEKITTNQSIILEKQEGKWQVSNENDFTNILLPGFSEAISAFN